MHHFYVLPATDTVAHHTRASHSRSEALGHDMPERRQGFKRLRRGHA